MIEAGLYVWLLLQEPKKAAGGRVEFARDVQPILARRCQPCHFPGGSMHAKLPFDRAETIDHLGTKLFSRIKKEGEQEIIRKYLGQRRKGS